MDIKSLFTGGIDKIVDSVGNAIDKLVTSDEERQTLKNALMEAKLKTMLESERNWVEHEQEITKRWVSDNEHFITRLVRPAIVVWSYVILTIAMFFDGNVGEFNVKAAYLPMLETITITVTLAYFGGRSYEKGRRWTADKIVKEVNQL